MNLNLHRVTKLVVSQPEVMQNALGKQFALRKLLISSENGSFEIVLFSDTPNNLNIVEENV